MSKGASFLKRLADIFSSILAAIWRLLPFRINLVLGKLLAFLWVDVFLIRKKVIYENLHRAFPNASFEVKKEIARRSMQNMCRSFFDIILIPSVDKSWVEKHVVLEGLENLRKAQESHKGLLFLTLHLGSGDLAGAVISNTIVPMALITKRFKNQFLDRFWFNLRGASKTEFIDAHAKRNAFEILSYLKKSWGVGFVLDQFMGKPYGVETNFFGEKTGSAYGLALFAKKTQAPVIPVYNYWDSDQKFHVCFGERIDLTPFSGDDEETYKVNATNRFNAELEKIIKLHPEHWMWVHRRWKKFE